VRPTDTSDSQWIARNFKRDSFQERMKLHLLGGEDRWTGNSAGKRKDLQTALEANKSATESPIRLSEWKP